MQKNKHLTLQKKELYATIHMAFELLVGYILIRFTSGVIIIKEINQKETEKKTTKGVLVYQCNKMSLCKQPSLSHPVENRQHHVELLLLLFLCHVARWVAELREETAQVHESQRVVLWAALLLPWPPHDPLHHIHFQRLLEAEASPDRADKYTKERFCEMENGEKGKK